MQSIVRLKRTMTFLKHRHLRYFRAIAREGTLTGAATQLGVSQSAMSVQMRQLGESVGQALLHREK
jgi:LysR family transcriptional activator of nhaA